MSLLSNQQLQYWLALNRLQGFSPDDISTIIQHHEHLELFFHAKDSRLFSSSISEQIKTIDWHEIERELLWLAQPHCHVITILDDLYPDLLRQINSPPLLLYVQGNVDVLKEKQLAIVGSRNPTPMGYETAREFGRFLAAAGFVVTSGLAMGIDAASHEGALSQGQTIGVLGTGLNNIYPKRNCPLAERIIEKGALVSEFPLNTAALPKNFPRRNRIISGLSLGVLVVEAALRSGSLITAQFALEQNREVFAIPGSIHNPLSKGCHKLLKAGAKLVESGDDILLEIKELPLLINELSDNKTRKSNHNIKNNQKNNREKLDFFAIDGEYENLLACIGFEITAIDTIINLSGLTPEVVSSMLLMLELHGCLQSVPGGYVRVKLLDK